MKEFSLEEQRKLVFSDQPELDLVAACKLDNGVIKHSEFEKKKYIIRFSKNNEPTKLFIPASGSGSRMFQFLFDFLEEPNEENRGKTERFLNNIQDFAFFELLPYELKNKVRDYDINLDEFVEYLLNEEGLGLGEIPKGLLPFHRSRSFILNAFQEQFLQGLRLKENNISYHFTVNEDFEKKILEALSNVKNLTGRKCDIKCSSQDPRTDAYAFDENQQPIKLQDGELLKRPSGHGALLSNLNEIDSEIIFIKNIDNVQHESKAASTIENIQYLGGLLQTLKDELLEAVNSNDFQSEINKINETYHLFHKEFDLKKLKKEELLKLLSRPIRVCGMVRNEGQPGGGPFWVNNGGFISKQIVEKAQIKMRGEQYKLMVQSQYFNPVLMAVTSKNIFDKKLDLTEFSDESKYFIVDKKHVGQPIKFMERPGLWNGSMSDWLTVFVEVPSTAFTPVKNVLDLLNDAHREG